MRSSASGSLEFAKELMESLFQQLINTVALRPYVFIFLAVYLVGCSMAFGLKRALFFIVPGYLITWLSEFSSINTGIPYGNYFYIEDTKGLELWVFGVPFMDSLSYIFLTYASYSMALLTVSPLIYSRGMIYLLETHAVRQSLFTAILGAVYFVYLDIIIDPLSLQGSKWFLGQIYGYGEAGVYFGVPISNFIGWIIVGFILIFVFQKIDSVMMRRGIRDHAAFNSGLRQMIGPGLYAGIIAFNIFMTFYIGDGNLGWVGIFIFALPLFLLWAIIRTRIDIVDIGACLEAHIRDFPEAERRASDLAQALSGRRAH
jgi:uncharacterized membrane protein